MSSIDRNDPRLTAYALDEMGGRERKAFERALARDPEARAEVEAIRRLAAHLEEGLAGASVPMLLPDQRERLARAAEDRAQPWWNGASAWARAAAALVVLGVVAGAAALLATSHRGASTTDEVARYLYEEVGEEVKDVPSLQGPEAGEARPPPPTRPPADPRAPAPDAPRLAAEVPAVVGLLVESGRSGLREQRAQDALEVEGAVHGARPPFHTEGYDRIRDNPFVRVADQDSSTFGIDVDTASYANVRRFLAQMGRLPLPDAVRIEELVNYFPYGYEPPARDGEHPFAAHAEVAACPWEPAHRLVRIALKGRVMEEEGRPAANLVFLLDVSRSMRPANKLPLLKAAMKLLVDRLDEGDRVAIVVYAGAAGLVLPSTTGDRKEEIVAALDRLRSGGSTNGGAGIELAYQVAMDHFLEGGVNRVILCTDGDFNVGVSDRGSLTRLIEEKARSGVFLTVLGFGMGNYKDDRMEELSNRGNGNYAYVDTLREARKVLVEEGLGTLVTIAKDVKIQIFFNPARVAGWRLIGYENRLLRKEDFNDDTKDAGEIGAGHAVTALYEIVPAGRALPGPLTDPNPFVTPPETVAEAADGALLRLRLRYKAPDGDTSTLMEEDVFDAGLRFDEVDRDFQWATAVAGFGMLLRDSPHKGATTWALVEEIAQAARGEDPGGYRSEFLQLVRLAADLSPR